MTHRENVLRRLGLPTNIHLSLTTISHLTGVPMEALHEIMERGKGAWFHNEASVRLKKDFSKNPNTNKYPRTARLPMLQWQFARVFSFLDHGKDYYTADHDIAVKYGIK
jgi:hypothetical protein